jgi:hypothetical protein
MCDETKERHVLATVDGLGSVTLCGCGTVSLHLGGVSIRMDADTFGQAVAMCREAVATAELQVRSMESVATKKQSLLTH